MAELVQKVALQDSFDARGVFVSAGHIGAFDPDKLNGEEKHLLDPGEIGSAAMVEIAAIAPTGPNPRMPQQLPPDAVQSAAGEYVLPGKVLVGETTVAAEARLDDRGLGEDNKDREAEVDEALAKAAEKAGVTVGAATSTTAENSDDALVNGNVKEVTAGLGTKTDAELEQMRAAEQDREQPRKGVLNAIDAELEARKANA